MIKRQKKLILIGAAVAVVLMILYFAVIRPFVFTKAKEEVPELLPGEVLGVSNRIQMMEHIENVDIARLEVHNANGGYTFYRGADSTLYIEGLEYTPYSLSALSSVVVASGYTLSMERLENPSEDLHEYGLAPDDDPAWYEITTLAGVSHKIWIGDKIVTGAGYYARYDGRDAIYILDSTVSVLLDDVCDLITPILSYPVASTDYTSVDNLFIIRDGECLIWIDYMTSQEVEDTASLGEYRFLEPADYTPNLNSYSAILELLADFEGEAVVKAFKPGTAITNEDLMEFGIDFDNPAYAFHYTCKGIDSFIYFSEFDENGYGYAYAGIYNTIVRVSLASASFLEWDLLKFVDPPLFYKNINDIAKIEIETADSKVSFTLDGYDNDLDVTDSTGSGVYDEDDLRNFRQFYKSILLMKLEDYTERDDIENLECLATLTATTDSGYVTTYRFYPYSTRRCYYTVDGEGEFYLLRDSIEKVLNDCQRVVNGVPVDSDAKN